MPTGTRDSVHDDRDTRVTASAVRDDGNTTMLNRRDNGSGSAAAPRGKLVEDVVDFVEQGQGDKGSMQWNGDGDLASKPGALSAKDKKALVLLIALCPSRLQSLASVLRLKLTWSATTDLIQGVPVGLAFGSIPFLLRAKLSYSQIGIFTLCTYPYSLKLLWSPIVDSIFSPKLGRRKSWIVPVQLTVGFMLWWLSTNVQSLMDVVSLCGKAGPDCCHSLTLIVHTQDEPDVQKLTLLFFTLVFFAATQDIAVDGKSDLAPGPSRGD